MLTTNPFDAQLAKPLYRGEHYLPLRQEALADLMLAIPDGDYTFLTIRDRVNEEIIRVEHVCGTFVINRAQDGTIDSTFPIGSCIMFRVTPAIVKELICTHNCCEGDCPCEPVASAGYTFPSARVGVAWAGTVVFIGDTPMEISVDGLPSWASVSVGANYVSISGTPSGAGTFGVAVAATNCSGAVAVQQTQLVITN